MRICRASRNSSRKANKIMPEEKKQLDTSAFQNLIDTMFKSEKGTEKTGSALEKNSLFKSTASKLKGNNFSDFFASLKNRFSIKKSSELIVGLDIGTSAVKCAVFFYREGDLRLVSLDIEEIPHEHFESASRPEVVKNKIRALQSRHAVKGKVLFTANLPNLLTELMYMPVMPQEELDKAIRWQAREKLLVDEETYIIDYLLLGEANVAQQAEKKILFFAVPRKDILEYYYLLSSLGLKIQAIRPNFLAIFQAFENKSLWRDDEAVGFLDIGAGSSQFSIITGGYVHFNRRLDVSGDSLTRSVADYCQLSYEEAEKYKKEIGISKMALEEDRKEGNVAEQPRVRISHAIGLHLDRLITEIQHTFNYYSFEVSNAPLAKMDRLIVTGGGASLAGLCDFFKSRLNIPVDIYNLLNYIQSAGRRFEPSLATDNNSSRFSAAIGLAVSSRV